MQQSTADTSDFSCKKLWCLRVRESRSRFSSKFSPLKPLDPPKRSLTNVQIALHTVPDHLPILNFFACLDFYLHNCSTCAGILRGTNRGFVEHCWIQVARWCTLVGIHNIWIVTFTHRSLHLLQLPPSLLLLSLPLLLPLLPLLLL